MICQVENPAMSFPAPNIHSFAGRPRVLVAEDQADVVAALHLLLKRNGYEAEFVNTPTDALDALRSRQFDIALLDLNYSRDTTSGSEGLELVSQVQAIDNTLAIVVMTAWGSIPLAVSAMHRGAFDFVQKPWDNTQLLAILNKEIQHTHSLRQKKFSEELERQEAAQVQRALMPGEIMAPQGMSIAACSQSMKTVGGDYYDVIPLDQFRSAVCIADVVGKGVGAALLMSNLQASVRLLASEVTEPATFCRRLNQAISANKVPGKFITFFYCVIDSERRRISFTNAGHNWPILAHADGSFERLSTEDTVLGTSPGLSYHQQEVELRSGDRLVLFTDGITEASSADGNEFGEEHLAELAAANVTLSSSALKENLLDAAQAHCSDAWTDDATLIVVAIE
jgi:phosphoserine phosphatase RsbU/P